MHHHLALIKTGQSTQSIGHVGAPVCLPDMVIIYTQALLMDAGSASFKAIKSGEIEGILARLVAIAYCALEALSKLGCDVFEYAGENRLSYQMLDIMRLLSNRINDCASGEAKHYSALYHLCSHLVTDFLNADFDKAFLVYHEWLKANHDTAGQIVPPHILKRPEFPDLTDCLYE